MLGSMASWLQARRFRRVTTILFALGLSIVTIVLLVNSLVPAPSLPAIDHSNPTTSGSNLKFPLCSDRTNPNVTWPLQSWRAAAETKFDGLLDDKFTIAMSTFHRPKELRRTLTTLLSAKIPSLHEIVVIWNNFDEKEPDSFVSEYGVSVRYRKPPRDSLNEKLWPDPKYRTKAILLSDDDVFYRPEDLEFVFQMWRKFGKDRMTGALARCVSALPSGDWDYNFCSQKEHQDVYSIVLTNLAFTHIAFLDYYFSDDPVATKIRKYVDDAFNCEDIGLNFVASMLTGSGPLLVRGRHQYVNLDPAGGISRKPGHMEARSKCLNVFAEAFQCMPLVNETGRIEHGVKHNVWYKSLWDVIHG
ncbi:glycosyltransferase family 64 [Trichoderma arundinaceum]|uniref:Glycosyltransferase family 64 n=1 Tax=Trichoderma arundinaceum TaxID=490622 RepID=A0A395NIX9_TRIAR|nr:glycosyltransferase family 64 [Trichoderma arundinaceum]